MCEECNGTYCVFCAFNKIVNNNDSETQQSNGNTPQAVASRA